MPSLLLSPTMSAQTHLLLTLKPWVEVLSNSTPGSLGQVLNWIEKAELARTEYDSSIRETRSSKNPEGLRSALVAIHNIYHLKDETLLNDLERMGMKPRENREEFQDLCSCLCDGIAQDNFYLAMQGKQRSHLFFKLEGNSNFLERHWLSVLLEVPSEHSEPQK